MKDVTQSWINYASADLGTAKLLMMQDSFPTSILFHSHQAIEKILKAILSEAGLQIPKIHNLLNLYEQIPDEVRKKTDMDINHLRTLNNIYIDSRYPGDIGLLPNHFPTQSDAREIFEISENIFQKIDTLIPR